MDSNQYAIQLVTYLLVLVIYFYELIAYMLLERNAFDSIAFFHSVRFIYLSSRYQFRNNKIFANHICLLVRSMCKE